MQPARSLSLTPPPVVRTVLNITVPALILAVIWFAVDGPVAVGRLAGASAPWLLASLALVNFQTVLCAMRWRLTAAQLGQPIGLRDSIAEYYLAQLLNQILPGGLLGDAARAVRARHAADLVTSGQAVVIERVSGQLALQMVLLPALVASVLIPGGIVWPAGLIGWGFAAGLTVVAVAGAMMALGVLTASIPVVSGLPTAVRRAIAGPGVWQCQALLSLGVVACNLGAFSLAAHATGTALSFEAIVTLVPLILVAMLLPFSLGGWGWREGAAAALFPLAGATGEAGLAASVAFGLMVLVAGLPGLLRLRALPSGSD